MSIGSPKLERREQAIAATRRRLRRLEIETHRIKAELARLEADYEDDVADRLSRKLRRRTSEPDNGRPIVSDGAARPAVIRLDPHTVTGVSDPDLIPSIVRPRTKSFGDASRNEEPSPPPAIAVSADEASPALHSGRDRKAPGYRAASPLFCSLAVHALGLLLCASLTVAAIVKQQVELFASPVDLNEVVAEEISEVEIETTRFDDTELQNVAVDNEEFNITDNLAREFEPTELGAGIQSLGEIGQLDALPSDLGNLMAGAGDPGSGRPGGPAGEAVFFGAPSKGDRFVFVVDNSSSMKGGRLEAAITELVATVESLSPRQTFYVIFVSDQTYPMFYPEPAASLVPATAPNKKLLAEWLPKAILASGNNRKLISAMDMAAVLRPHAVFLLWDGDLKYSDKVRMDVMTHLTQANWDFTVHTLGMGVTSLDSQHNLAAIAQAHGGTFRRVDVPATRQR